MESAKLFQLMPEKTARSFRLSTVTQRRLERLADILEKNDTAILEDAIAHLLGTIDRDLPVYLTSLMDKRKGPKRPPAA